MDTHKMCVYVHMKKYVLHRKIWEIALEGTYIRILEDVYGEKESL